MAATAAAAEGAIVPDAARGGTLFTSAIGCSGCHSTGTDTIIGPGLAGLKDRVKDRISQISAAPRGGSATDEGTQRNLLFTAEDYAESSIMDSQRYIVPGFEAVPMPEFPDLTPQDVADLVAYVLTLN
jgi:cytochrome c2